MSFAQGFAAGSAAAQRGIDMGLAMKKREEEEQYKAQMAELANEYQMSQGAVTAYEQQRAGLEATGAPMASAVAQPQYSPEAQRIFGIGGPAPQMSMSPVSAPTAGLVAGDRAGVVMPEAPQAMSPMDLRQRAATLALGAGRYDDYMAAQEALAGEAARQEQLNIQRGGLQLQRDQFTAQETEAERVRLEKEKNRSDMTEVMGMLGRGAKVSEINTFIGGTKLDPNEVMQTIQNTYNIQEAEVEQEMKAIRQKVSGMTFEDLKKAHKEDSNISPGEYYDVVTNPETGLFDIVVKDDATDKITGIVGSESDMASVENTLRTMAYDRTTALESLATKAAKRRSAAAEAAIEKAKMNVDIYEADADTKEKLLSEINQLNQDPMFMTLAPKDQQKRIADLYKIVGLEYKSDIQAVEEPAPEPGAVDKALADLEKTRQEKREQRAGLEKNVDKIVDLRNDQEAFNVAMEAATPDAREAVQQRVAEIRQQEQATQTRIKEASAQQAGLYRNYRPY